MNENQVIDGTTTQADPDSWLDQHGDVLYRFAYLRVRDADVAEDLLQETLVKAIAGFDRFRHESSVRTWLFSILRNEIHRFFRVESKQREMGRREPIGLDSLLHPRISSSEFSSATEREEFWDMIQHCYEQLPEHLLDTFLARLASPDEKVETLCGELNITPSNASVRLFRARLLLRRCVEQTWVRES